MMSLPKEVSWQGWCHLKEDLLPEVQEGRFLSFTRKCGLSASSESSQTETLFGSKIFEEGFMKEILAFGLLAV